MHDIDRTQQEAMEFGAFESEQFEFAGEFQEVFNEAEQMELAAELLEVRDEQELDRFLGNLIRRAGRAVGQAIRSPTGQAIGAVLKNAAKDAARQIIPIGSQALSSAIGGRLGPVIGSGVSAMATQALGLEQETLNQEDREFEGAKQFVRLAGDVIRNTATASPAADPRAAARAAIVQAAQQLAPGLLQTAGAGAGAAPTGFGGRGQSGRWLRRGNKIVLFGA
jgi:hypothetical protein